MPELGSPADEALRCQEVQRVFEVWQFKAFDRSWVDDVALTHGVARVEARMIVGDAGTYQIHVPGELCLRDGDPRVQPAIRELVKQRY
jgi:hypothetical protein